MKRIDENLITEIIEKNDIVDVLSNYVSLNKKGKNYVCLCPFHNDTNPSMVVSQEKQIYKCFSCGAGGNVITFIKDYEKVDFLEALQKLANYSGIELNITTDQASKQQTSKFEEYYQINEEASNLYQYLLNENQSLKAEDYLQKRKIDDKIKVQFKIGYGGTTNVLCNLLRKKRYDLNKAVELGLLRIKGNEYFDSYDDRIIYPILDLKDKVVGFTCRALGDASPKYLNSIESKVFDKSQVFYNINNAKEAIKKEKKVYVLEGPNDVMAFYRAKFENVVCVMGTALTNKHLQVLKELRCAEVILGFDGDSAGKKATYHAIEILQNHKIDIKYLDFDKYDPDEYLNKYGVQRFIELVKQPKVALEFKIDYELSLININSYQEKKDVVIKLVNELNQKLDDFDREYYYNYLANVSGVSFEVIESYAKKRQIKKVVSVSQPIKAKKIVRSDLENAMICVIFYMMLDKKYFDFFNSEIGTFINQKYRKLYNVIAAYYLNSNIFKIAELDKLEVDETIVSELTGISLDNNYDFSDKQIFLDSIDTLKLEGYYLELAKRKKELENYQDPLEKAAISSEILKLNGKINDAKQKKFNK